MFDRDKLAEIKEQQAEWEKGTLRKALERSPEQAFAPPPLPIKRLYTPLDIPNLDYRRDLGFPGEYPYTRGIQPTMYRGRFWTMRQYAGFGTVEETNQRFKFLLKQGITGMNIAFDLPSQLGYDPDHPRAAGEVGNVGIACPSLREMEILLDGIPLDQVTPAMAINAPAQIMLSMYIAVGEKQGLKPSDLAGTTQNDILKEFIARGNYIFPVRPSIRLAVDLFEYCTKNMPRWNFTNVCGYHMREAGSTPVQELAFAFADAIVYIEAALERGMNIDDFAPRLAFNFAVFNNVLQEVAKFRAARRLWAKIMKGRFQAKNPASMMFRTGAGSGGSTLTAQQPENNIVRVTLHTLISALAGCQSLHTASWDEALALPSERAVTLALRTQQIVAYESGAAEVIDPLAGSYYLESLTDTIEQEVSRYMEKIESVGGMVRAIESGWVQREIATEAYRFQREVEMGQRVVVGVNRFVTEEPAPIELHRMDPRVVAKLKESLSALRRERDQRSVAQALAKVREVAEGKDNLMPYILEAVKSYVTVGEICGVLREVFGEYQPAVF